MDELDMAEAIYKEKKAAYNRMCDAYSQAMAAANEIKGMCDVMQEEMFKAGEQLIKLAQN